MEGLLSTRPTQSSLYMYIVFSKLNKTYIENIFRNNLDTEYIDREYIDREEQYRCHVADSKDLLRGTI